MNILFKILIRLTNIQFITTIYFQFVNSRNIKSFMILLFYNSFVLSKLSLVTNVIFDIVFSRFSHNIF